MNAEKLRSLQAPLKQRYREAPDAALITLRAEGRLGEDVSCRIETGNALRDGPSPAEALAYYRAALALRPETV